eukprot:m.310850 g.310850  ORF g.310850 m.310850 type:complete len:156 (+) comp55576_c0_seq1:378-845(+)
MNIVRNSGSPSPRCSPTCQSEYEKLLQSSWKDIVLNCDCGQDGADFCRRVRKNLKLYCSPLLPATAIPTTESMLTDIPTTEVPSTKAPTTESPTSGITTTEVPTTDMPSTESLSTKFPTKETRTTEMTTSKAPINDVIHDVILLLQQSKLDFPFK